MNHNLLYIREKSNISKKLLSILLNISVYTYTGYEINRLIAPNEIFIMISKIYDISTSDLFCDINSISDATIKKLDDLANADELERESRVIKNLTGFSNSPLSYREINHIKTEIINKINYKEVSE